MAKAQQSPPDFQQLAKDVAQWLKHLPDQDAPIGATVEFKVQPGMEAEFQRHSEVLSIATQRQPGLDWYSYDKIRSDTPPGMPGIHEPSYIIIERWKSVREFRTHQWLSPHLTAFQMKVGQFLAGPPEVKFIHGSFAGTDVLSVGPHSPNRFVNNGDGTITDSETGLVWMENANTLGTEVNWMAALEFANHLQSGQHGLNDNSQKGDWRLPNVNEYQSILDLTNESGPSLTPGVFKNGDVANYWTSTSVAAFPALAWYTAMAVGPPVFDLKINNMRAWAVRGTSTKVSQTGQDSCWDMMGNEIPPQGTGMDGEKSTIPVGLPLPDQRFQVNRNVSGEEDGTVTDRATGLTWLIDADAFGTNCWDDAKDLCGNLCEGHPDFNWLKDGSRPGDWYLPNVNELRSLEDYGEARPAIAKGHPFRNVRESLCWSSTEVASSRRPGKEATLARFLYVGIGSCVWDHKSLLGGVWPCKKLP